MAAAQSLGGVPLRCPRRRYPAWVASVVNGGPGSLASVKEGVSVTSSWEKGVVQGKGRVSELPRLVSIRPCRDSRSSSVHVSQSEKRESGKAGASEVFSRREVGR